jgi:hypothetical protein
VDYGADRDRTADQADAMMDPLNNSLVELTVGDDSLISG